jgi:dihydrolipoamide dehydrogenase
VIATAEDGTLQTISAKSVILATGSEPASLPGVDVDEKTVVTSTGALSLTEVPKRMVVIGGGGCTSWIQLTRSFECAWFQPLSP